MEGLEITLIVVAILLTAFGIIGCVAPALPGPPLSYLGLIALHFADEERVFSTTFLIVWLAITIAVAALDFFMPVFATKKFGGTKYGIWGGAIGLLVGILFFPPFGIIIGPLLGAIAGDLIAGSQFQHAIKSGIGSFIGFMIATGIKLAASITMAVFLIINLVKLIGKDLNLFG